MVPRKNNLFPLIINSDFSLSFASLNPILVVIGLKYLDEIFIYVSVGLPNSHGYQYSGFSSLIKAVARPLIGLKTILTLVDWILLEPDLI